MTSKCSEIFSLNVFMLFLYKKNPHKKLGKSAKIKHLNVYVRPGLSTSKENQLFIIYLSKYDLILTPKTVSNLEPGKCQT